MGMGKFLYHGQAVGFSADIWEPGPHTVPGHASCGVHGEQAGNDQKEEGDFEIPDLVKHSGCKSSVSAKEVDAGHFRTEVKSSLYGLNVEKGVLTADEITLGIVSVYRSTWWDNGRLDARRVRVVPYGCKIVNLRFHGVPVPNFLPAPFQYSKDRCDDYLENDKPDATVEAEIRDAITNSASRFMYVKNFGRIFLGEWTLLPGDNWRPTHQITMLRMALGSPQTGSGSGGSGQGGGGGGGTGG